ncbi:MAG TPA: PCYCGC motif-containing (lipo)protein [Candidatus Xenobia bacterium]|nr:PCYCGC motif-containing (lipo)protein [Candidatus Xenobia bacterium]
MRHARATAFLFLAAAVWLSGCSSAEQKPAPAPQPALTPPAAHGSSPATTEPQKPPVPPFHESAEAAKPFPTLMPPERYRDYPVIERAYRVAHRLPGVVAQQPCYCWCNKVGHTSLLDCYASDHGAG